MTNVPGKSQEDGFTSGPWIWTTFTKPDGSPIETAQDVADTTAFSALKSDRAELHGVTLSGEDDGIVVCYTGNGPNAHNNARLIAAAPDMFAALQELAEARDGDDLLGWVQDTARAAIAKARKVSP